MQAGFSIKKVREVYGLILKLLDGSRHLYQGAKGEAAYCWSKTAEKLVIIRIQTKVLYQKVLWICTQKCVSSFQTMNHYVIYARGFFDAYTSSVSKGTEISYQEYLKQVKELGQIINLPLKDITQAREFFSAAKVMWETKLLGIYEDRDNKELLETLKKVVALELGKFDERIGLNFYDVYQQLANLNVEIYLEDYVNECKEVFDKQWKDDYSMENLALDYFIYNRWSIEELDKEAFKEHAAYNGVIGRARKICNYMVDLAFKQYFKLYSTLLDNLADEKESKEMGIKEVKKLNTYTIQALINCKEAIKKTFNESKMLSFEVSLNFAKTNALRLLNFGNIMVKKFKEGMTMVHDKSVHTVTVVVRCVKDPKEVKKVALGALENVKCAVVGCYLVFDFDADDWVSMKDIANTLLKLLSIFKKENADNLGGSKALYMKAIGCLKSQKKIEGTKVEKETS